MFMLGLTPSDRDRVKRYALQVGEQAGASAKCKYDSGIIDYRSIQSICQLQRVSEILLPNKRESGSIPIEASLLQVHRR